MNTTKCLSRQTVAFITLLLISITFTSTISSANADPTTLYLNWTLPDEDEVEPSGHLTLSGLPETMEYNQTYKVEITLTLESGNSQDLRSLSFYLNLSSGELPLGNCAVNSTLHRAESFTLYSHWEIEYNGTHFPDQGNLVITAYIENEEKTFETTPKDITIKLKEPSILNLTKAEANNILSLPSSLYLFDEVSVDGKLASTFENDTYKMFDDYNITWPKITLTYLTPNGTEIIRQISADKKGYFTDKFVPNLAGTWRVIANWSGTEKYSASSSDTLVFEVEGPNFMILVLVLVIVGLIAGFSPACYYFWPREKNIYPMKQKETKFGVLKKILRPKKSES